MIASRDGRCDDERALRDMGRVPVRLLFDSSHGGDRQGRPRVGPGLCRYARHCSLYSSLFLSMKAISPNLTPFSRSPCRFHRLQTAASRIDRGARSDAVPWKHVRDCGSRSDYCGKGKSENDDRSILRASARRHLVTTHHHHVETDVL